MTSSASKFFDSIAHAVDEINRSLAPVDTGGAAPTHSRVANASEDIAQLLAHGLPVGIADIPAYWDAAKNFSTNSLDDRKLVMEDLIKVMSRLHTIPNGQTLASLMEQWFIDFLYKDLPHPPSGYLSSPDFQMLAPVAGADAGGAAGSNGGGPGAGRAGGYPARSDNGSGYNPLFPSLGKAGEPYARSVPSLHYTPVSSLPDTGLVFDTLLKRTKFEEHPGGINSLFFAFANTIIHNIFNTSYKQPTTNDASSYLDLSPLYGGGTSPYHKKVTDMRCFDGTGKIWQDTFADSRLMLMPPSTGAMLILFNRNHNYICDKLLAINEKKSFSSPPPTDENARRAQDDEIFSRARLINCGFYMQIILQDYVGSILGLERDGLDWRLHPLEATRDSNHEVTPRGEGNVCSIEFNLLYRWHATMSQPDEQWTSAEFKKMFGDKTYDEVTPRDFVTVAAPLLVPPPNVRDWTFGGLKRDANGLFADNDIADIIQKAMMAPAAAFGARGTPEWLRVIEVLGMEQARTWGTCTLNEFRKFLGLKVFEKFEDWNPNPEVWKAAEALYHHIDNLELHPGLQAEASKKPGPGAGLCPGYTISRAILGDAVALTRGDPYLTVAMTPYNYTSWGYQDCQVDVDDGSYGGILTRLLYRTLPQYFGPDSGLAHFPFMVPGSMQGYMQERNPEEAKEYTWKPRPAPVPLVVVKTYNGVDQILSNPQTFHPRSGGFHALTNVVADRSPVARALKAEIPSCSEKLTQYAQEHINKRAIPDLGKPAMYFDVAEMLNRLPCFLIANDLAGLPLKDDTNAYGTLQPEELYQMFADIADHCYHELEPSNAWSLRSKARKAVDDLLPSIQRHLTSIAKGFGSIASLKDIATHLTTTRNDHSGTFLANIVAASPNRDPQTTAVGVVAEIVASAAMWSAALVHAVDFYLDDAHAEQRQAIITHCADQSAAADAALLGYIYEAMRLRPPVTSAFYHTEKAASVAGQDIPAGADVLVSLVDANLDTTVFGPDPQTSTIHPAATLFNTCQHGMMSPDFFAQTAPRVLRFIFTLPGLCRAPGASGAINSFTETVYGVPQRLFVNQSGLITPFPTSLLVHYSTPA